ncbi:MAG: bifunctional riboflavin kinase/FAD synthetase [Thermoanaerobaculia bacterium]
MQIIQNTSRTTDLPRGCVATIGNYDGVHRGQAAVLAGVVARARALGVPAAVVTFEPHPLAILAPAQAPVPLLTPVQKEQALAACGIDVLLRVPFTAELAATRAETFVREFLVGKLRVAEVHVGRRFAFGNGREGNLALLERLGAELGFRAVGVDETTAGHDLVSSTRIRRALAEGDVEAAAAMLGRPYAIEGKILRGDRMGQRLGFPTINLASENRLLPADGVYATRAYFPSFPATFDSVTNIGTRPTVYENHQRVVESHILDFSSDVYGERVSLAFHHRLREEKLFPSVMELSRQIRSDVETTREYFAAARRSQEGARWGAGPG